MGATRRLGQDARDAAWPALPFDGWADSCTTLHRWIQIVGKVRLAQAPLVNHWWQVPLYVTSRGLTTSPMPHGERTFQIDFDFIDHRLLIAACDGAQDSVALAPCAVADFYRDVMARLRALGIEVTIRTMPQEMGDTLPFELDRVHASYDRAQVHRCWRALVQADRVMQAFRARFVGKVSPVHLFWGAFDLAVTRFSGRPAPRHPGAPGLADFVTHEAYSHEASSCGFWPGDASLGGPAFYAYAYPEPAGFADAPVLPVAAYYSRDKHEFLLPYDAVRVAARPDDLILDFFQSTYAAAADLGRWDRGALERRAAP